LVAAFYIWELWITIKQVDETGERREVSKYAGGFGSE